MRKSHCAAIMVAALIAALPACAAADSDCALTYTGSDDVIRIIKQHKFGFDGYDRLCARLSAEGLALDIHGDWGRIKDQPFSWALITMYSLKLEVDGDVRQSITTIRDDKTAEPEDMFMDDVNSVLDDISKDADSMIKSVRDKDEKVTKAVMAAAKP